jgi:putative transposase
MEIILPKKKINMANSYSQMYVHTIFAVKYRNALIKKDWSGNLYAVIGNLIKEKGCKPIIINGVQDHIHCFIGLKPVVSVSELMQVVKGRSSKYINDYSLTPGHFEWQEGYGAFTYAHSQISTVCNYIENQEAHHETETFRIEYMKFLEKFEVPFDERYIFHDPI